MKNQSLILSGLLLSFYTASCFALTPFQQAFQDGQTAAAAGTAAGVAATSSTSVNNTIGSFNPTYYNTSGTAPETALFLGGNGNTQAAGAAKVSSCQTGAPNPDKFLQQNCDAINFMVKNPTIRPQFTISPSSPLITNFKAITSNPSAMAATAQGFSGSSVGGGFTACTKSTATTPAVNGTEVCNDFTVPASQSCTMGQAVVVNANTNYQCNLTANAYQTSTCARMLNTVITQPPPVTPANATGSCSNGAVMIGGQCQAAAMAGYVNYACSAGSALNGTQCQPAPTTATLNYSCTTGTLSGASCVQPAISATTTYSCPAGGALNGTSCQAAPSNAAVTYSCPAGSTQNGSQCQAPGYQPPAVGATASTSLLAQSYFWSWTAYPFWNYQYATALQYCNSVGYNSVVSSGLGYQQGNMKYYLICGQTKASYSCPTGYTPSGTSCYPPKVTPPPTSATPGYSCPANYTLSGTTCIPPASSATPNYSCPVNYSPTGSGAGTTCITPATAATASYSCPTGSIAGTSCIQPPVGATVSYTCPANTTPSGSTCTPPATTPLVTYSCGPGTTLSGSTCIQSPVYTNTWIDGCTTLEAAAK